ncbi:MAG TPA: hypothetical protein VF406_21610 [Thermodesulfobacteriota bacterium]
MTRRMAGCVAAGLALPAGAAALTLALATRAAAQQRFELVPSVGLSETFSDNVDFVPENERSGFTSNVTPGIRAGVVGGKLEGTAQYAVNFRFEHFREGESPGVDHNASARLDYMATPRWRLFLREDFRLSPDPTQDLVFVTPQGQTFRSFEEAARTPGVDVLDLRSLLVREDEIRNQLRVGTDYDLTPRWAVGAEALWIVNESLDDLFVEDEQTYAGRLSTDYRLTPADDLELGLRYDLTLFEVTPDATVVRADLSWERRISEVLRLALTAGYAAVRTRDGGDEGGDEVGDEDLGYGGATLRGDLAQGQWQLRIAREIGTGDGSGDVSTRDVLEASISRTLSPGLSAGGALAFLRTRSVRGLGTDSDTVQGTVSLSWRFIRWASALVSYRYRYEDQVDGRSGIDENSALVGIEVLWPIREMAGLAP